MSTRRPRQCGVALLTALVVLAIAAALSAGMIWSRGLDERRTATLVQGDQAFEYALGAEAWAEQILFRDRQQSKTQTTCLDQDWAAQLPPLPVQGGQIVGHLEDMQGRFNLNDLVSNGAVQPAYHTQFQQLLSALQLDPTLADAVTDWMTASTTPTLPGGVKDDYYTRLLPPYRSANQPMSDVSELELVKGITPDVYAQLLPYVWVLPTQTPINVNTASAIVIQSMGSTASGNGTPSSPIIDPQTAADIVAQRAGGCLNPNALPAALKSLQNATYDSSYFLLTAGVDIGTTHVTMYSLLKRESTGFTHAIQRTLGTF